MGRMWNKRSLDGIWNFYCVPNNQCTEEILGAKEEAQLLSAGLSFLPGKVPGSMETILMENGQLEDVFFGRNVLAAQKLENRHLWYVCHFACNNLKKKYLDFEGIDTAADIFLNGEKLCYVENMLIAHQVEAKSLHLGDNELMIHIYPSVLVAREKEIGAGAINFQRYSGDTLLMRKAAHMSGWDIMPRIVSGGLWRSVYLYERAADGIEDVYPATTHLEEGKATLHIYYKVRVSGDYVADYQISVKGKCGDSEFSASHRLRYTEGYFEITVDDPRLWWARPMGEPNLYDLTATLSCGGKVLDTFNRRLGIRTVKLKKTDYTDEQGNGEFCFLLNGEKMFVLGTNWVPMSALHDKDAARQEKCLALLDEMGCNMVRMWGGNVYEDESFYDFCDEKGIAVWQDFAMGCAVYPATEEMQRALAAEVKAVSEKFRSHACLFLWAGDNECDCSMAQWSYVSQNPQSNLLTRKVIPEMLQQTDPFREYLPSSPYISDIAYRTGNMDNTPEQHLWGPRKYYKADFYAKAIAHFASETGYHGCPSPASIAKFISPEKQFPWQKNEEWLLHASCMDTKDDPYEYRIPLMAEQIEILFGHIPENLQDFALASQISQAEADKYFVERFRWGKWRRTGVIWWNLIDGWPQFSDAITDYYFTKKLAFPVLQRVMKPLCMMVKENPEHTQFYLVFSNDTRENKNVKYLVKNSNGQPVALGTVTVPRSDVVRLPLTADMEVQGMLLLSWEADGCAYRNHYLTGKPPYHLEEVWKWYKEAGLSLPEGFCEKEPIVREGE